MNSFHRTTTKHQWRFTTIRGVFKRGFSLMGIGATLALAGCASQMSGESDSTQAMAPASDTTSSATIQKGPANTQSFGAANGTAQLIQAVSTVPRRIVYNAKVDLIAENFSKAQNGLAALVKAHSGYIAETDIGGTPGQPRQGTWKVRVPEDRFNAFMSGVSSLGELQSTHTDSQDVTAEFHDIEARISNKQVEEKRLIAHLQRSTAKLSDILQVERELSRVRGEIEQMQGRLRLLANMSSLATVTVTLHEVKGYVPPQPTSFGSQITRTFGTSLDAMQELGKGLVLALVGFLPWGVLLAIIGVPAWRLWRRYFNSRDQSAE